MLCVPPRSAPAAYGHFELLPDNVVTFGSNAFGLLTSWPVPSGPHAVSDLCWAPDLGAARRALIRDAAGDSGALATPPGPLLAAVGALSYSQIQAVAELGHYDHGFLFTGSGSCVGHYLSIKRFTYLFRSGALDPNERLYAILVDPDPDFWQFTAGVDLAALARALELSANLPEVSVEPQRLHARLDSRDLQLELSVWSNGCCDLMSLSRVDVEPQHRHYEFRGTEHAVSVLREELSTIIEARRPTRRCS